jgi:hypothetical protein
MKYSSPTFFFGEQNKENEMGRDCSKHGRNLKRYHLGDLGVDGRIKLILIAILDCHSSKNFNSFHNHKNRIADLFIRCLLTMELSN